MHRPLVTIGIPTYNRPGGLKKTLEHIINQSYKNIEIIVSNNASTDPSVDGIVKDFAAKDGRIRYFNHPVNKGPVFNFEFVFQNATGEFFMWAADDDYFESDDLLEKLIENSADNILTFPDVNLSNRENIAPGVLGAIYKNCVSKFDYINAWAKSGAGYPFYGVYNIKKLKESNIGVEFEDNLLYYTEGIFLHKIFIIGAIKFVPDVYIRMDNNSSRPNNYKLLKYFYRYCNDIFRLYLSTRVARKRLVLNNIFKSLRIHFQDLFVKYKKENGFYRSLLFILNKPIFLIFTFSAAVSKLRSSIRPSVNSYQ